MSTFLCKKPFLWYRCLESNGLSNFSNVTSTSSDGLWCDVYGYCPCNSSFTLWCMDPWLILMQDLVYYMLSWFLTSCYAESFIWCNCFHNSLCYALKSLVVCCWDTLVVVMHVFCFNIPFVPCWRDAHHSCFCVILIGVLWLRVLVVEHLWKPLLCEGILPCMIKTSSLVYIIFIDST